MKIMASIKDLKRMCESYGDHCTGCPLHELKKFCAPNTIPDNADEIVDKWVAEHPVKTCAMDFFEKFPNAIKEQKGVPACCFRNVYGNDFKCIHDCIACWNQEVKND